MARRLQGGGGRGDGLDPDAQVVGHGRGGQEVREEVRAGEGERHLLRRGPDPQDEAHAVDRPPPSLRRHVVGAVAAEPEDAASPGEVLGPDPPHARVVAVEHRHPAGREAFQDLRLGRRDVVHRGEELEVDGGHHRDHGYVRSRDGRQRPGDTGHLVGERNGHDLEWAPRQQLRQPGIFLRVLLGASQDGMGSNDQDATQVAVALLGDRTKLLFAPG